MLFFLSLILSSSHTNLYSSFSSQLKHHFEYSHSPLHLSQKYYSSYFIIFYLSKSFIRHKASLVYSEECLTQ